VGYQVIEQVVNAARRKVLVQDLIPVYYPNLYVTFKLSKRALDTTKKYLEHLALFEDFLAFYSIDLISRLEKRPVSEYLTDSEITRFVSDAQFSKDSLKKKYKGVRLHPTAYKSVGDIHARQRIEAVREYVIFIYEKLGDHSTMREAVNDVRKRFNRKIKDASPAWEKTCIDEIKGLTSRERDRLLEVLHPSSAENPFSNEALKLRNYIILLLGLDLGLRRSEMLLIKVSDIEWHSRRLRVVNLEDESEDPRTVAPQFKTHERMLGITDELYDALVEYESKYRFRKLPKGSSQARKNRFLLVSHRKNEGKPLSKNGADGVLSRVGRVVPELAHISLHILRHDAVYMMLESMREDLELLSIEDRDTEIQKNLTWMFGWSPKSNMPAVYGAKFWQEQSDKAMQKRAKRLKVARQRGEAGIRKGNPE